MLAKDSRNKRQEAVEEWKNELKSSNRISRGVKSDMLEVKENSLRDLAAMVNTWFKSNSMNTWMSFLIGMGE